jgi:SPP1 gp7 family putative phage head morphogenesis protein
MSYWANRQAKIQEMLTDKSRKKIERQLSKYYSKAAKKVIADFENTYNKVLLQIEEGQQPTPALLYKLDAYWEMQGQLRNELRRLGEKQIALLTKEFEVNFFDIYYSISLEGQKAFSTIDKAGALHLINEIWCMDGKSFSQRIWNNTELLVETLNEQLLHTVITGKKPTELKNLLQERFGVSYSRANTLVRTELSHIQTVAAKQRYEDYGLTKYKILGNDDDSCGNHSIDCHKMDGKQFLYSEMSVGKNAPPFHPNCKCCIVPVVE